MNQQLTAEEYVDLTIRETVAASELHQLAELLISFGWAIDLHTFPGTLSAAKENGRLFYPAGVGGQWETVISEMRPHDGIPNGPHDLYRDTLACQARFTQSTPLHKLIAIAEQFATPVTASMASDEAEFGEDFFAVDALAGGSTDGLTDSLAALADDEEEDPDASCTGRHAEP